MALTEKFTLSITAGTIGATMLGLATLASLQPASAQDIKVHNISAGHQTAAFTGKPVKFHLGPGYDKESEKLARLMAAAIQQNDKCDVTVTHEGFIPDSIDVEVDGRIENFSDIGSAGAWAAERCENNG